MTRRKSFKGWSVMFSVAKAERNVEVQFEEFEEAQKYAKNLTEDNSNQIAQLWKDGGCKYLVVCGVMINPWMFDEEAYLFSEDDDDI